MLQEGERRGEKEYLGLGDGSKWWVYINITIGISSKKKKMAPD